MKQYKSIKVDVPVYKQVDYIKSINIKTHEGTKKPYTMSDIIGRGLDLILIHGMERKR